MDHVPVTHNKREFMKESKKHKEVEAALRNELKDIVRQARKKATEDTVTTKIGREVDIWKDKISESLRSEEFRNYTSRFKNIEPSPDIDTPQVGEVDIEKRQVRGGHGKEQGESRNKRERSPRETHRQKRHVIRVKGQNIEFKHDFAPLGIKEPWKTYTCDCEKRLEIFTNTDFPAYLATSDKVFYAVIHIAEAISEVFVKAAQEELANADGLKQLILRKASELKAQL